MTGVTVDAVVIPGDRAERVDYPDDTIWLRAVGHGDIQVADYTSTDRDGPPAHSHPWDEAQIVVEGEVEFLVGDRWTGGGSGTVTARIIQVSIGPPTTASRGTWPGCSPRAPRWRRSWTPPAGTV